MGNWEIAVEPGAVDDWIERTTPDASEEIELVLWALKLPDLPENPAVIGRSPRGLPLLQATTHTEAEVRIDRYQNGPPYGLIVVNRFY